MAQIQYQFRKNDEYYTPGYAVYPIMERLKAGTTVWCPFDRKDSEYVRVLSAHGFSVVYGHIEDGQDFFQTDVPECDYIVSNPPYSLKGEIIRRLYEIAPVYNFYKKNVAQSFLLYNEFDQNITKESDPVRQTYYTMKKL